MDDLKAKARELMYEFKGADYVYGLGCLERIGEITAKLGNKVLLLTSLHQRDPENFKKIMNSFKNSGLELVGHGLSSQPNSPIQDVLRMKDEILKTNPDSIVTVSGGSGIDAAKAALVLATFGGDLEDYFGVGKVTSELKISGKKLLPLIAVQTASGSSAHLTKYSNITDFKTFQKKLIIDEAIVPPKCLFDYSLTKSMSPPFTSDGSFDGLAHLLEVYYGATPETYDKIEEIALPGIELILLYLKKAISNPSDLEAREALGLATDLGGYAIMIGGTNGAHLTSFSLVDILSHGRACAILEPYYTVFFAPAIQRQLGKLANILTKHGFITAVDSALSDNALGLLVAQGLSTLGKSVGYPTTLAEIKGMTDQHVKKALASAKNPQLESKLRNMPVPLTANLVDKYMGPVLEAARSGNFGLIKTYDE